MYFQKRKADLIAIANNIRLIYRMRQYMIFYIKSQFFWAKFINMNKNIILRNCRINKVIVNDRITMDNKHITISQTTKPLMNTIWIRIRM